MAVRSDDLYPDLPTERAYLRWVYERIVAMVRGAERHIAMCAGVNTAANTQIAKQQHEKIRRLEGNRDQILIGRLDLLTHETYYIGRIGVEGESRDDIAVVDWRASMGEKFYQAGASDPMGVGRRRSLQMRGREVLAYSDDQLARNFVVRPPKVTVARPPAVVERPALEPAAPGSTDDRLAAALPEAAAEIGSRPTADVPQMRAVDMVFDELARVRTSAMQDVVATIQAEQDRIIRASVDAPLVVQGGPGTGKTIVGLHRAAYVLYRHRQERQRETSVLVVGPNRHFIDYVRSVLPSLGEATSVQLALDELALQDLPRGERDRIRVAAVDPPAVARLKGSARMADVLGRALWAHAVPTAVSVNYQRRAVTLPADAVVAMVAQLQGLNLPWNEARKALADRLVDGLGKAYGDRLPERQRSLADPEAFRVEARRSLRERAVADQILPPLSSRRVVRRLLTDPALLDTAALVGFTPAQKESLLRPATKWKWSPADLPLVAEAQVLLSGRPQAVGHVIVDEAQDLSPMEWRMVSRRLSGGGITILGDLAQSTARSGSRSWQDLPGLLRVPEVSVVTLRVGYRVPLEIMNLVAPLIKEIEPSLPVPVSIRSTEEPRIQQHPRGDLWKMTAERLRELGAGSVGVIVSDGDLALAKAELRTEKVEILSAEQAKGLEFDHAIVLEPGRIAAGPTGRQLLLIALTRATKTLTVLHSDPLPAVLDSPPGGRG